MSNTELSALVTLIALFIFVQAGVLYDLKQRMKRLELRAQLIVNRVDALTSEVLDHD